jgi:hypothetical protein
MKPIPVFSEVNRYQTEDGQVELDVLATASSGNGWIVEVKWKNKRAGKKELAKLVEHAQDRKAQGWYISKAGYNLFLIFVASIWQRFFRIRQGYPRELFAIAETEISSSPNRR